MFFKVWSVVILVASWFVIPYTAIQVYQNPGDYWKWFGLVIWVYLMVSESVTVFSWRAKDEK
jgi:hypothetical protein